MSTLYKLEPIWFFNQWKIFQGEKDLEESFFDLTADIFSFDVFDTVLLRETATPTGIFLIMQHELRKNNLLSSSFLNNFAQFRVNAEKTVRRRTNNEEITLSQIYAFLAKSFCLSHEVENFLTLLELREELNSVYINPQILKVITSLRNRNARIVFVSDSYLPRSQIRKMIEKLGIWRDGDGLYVSSDLLVTKATGNLFRYMLKQEGSEPNNVIHIGDNFKSDVVSAKKIGLRPFQCKETILNRYEEALLGKSALHLSYESQLIAGASHKARINSNENDPAAHTLYCVGANVAGPIFLIYLLWLLREAKVRKIQRLYFISRDGQILLELAKRITNKIKLEMDLRYLYGSRQAWHIASTTELGEREFDWMLKADPVLSIRVLANRIGLTPEIFQDQLDKVFGTILKLDANLSNHQIEQLKDIMLRSELRDTIIGNSQKLRSITFGYLRQEGLLDDINLGIVDLGWHGYMLDSLTKILQIEGAPREIWSFYFGLLKQNHPYCPTSKKIPFFFYPGSERSFSFVGSYFANLLEIFASANHGTTLSYYVNESNYFPILKPQPVDGLEDRELFHLRKGMFDFLECVPVEFLNYMFQNSDLKGLRKNLACCMNLLYLNPSQQEAEVLGNISFSSDQSGTYLKTFAPEFSTSDSIDFTLSTSRQKRYSLTKWPEGTKARSKLLPRLLLNPQIRLTELIHHYLRMTKN